MPTAPPYTPLFSDASALAQKLHDIVEPVLANSRPPTKLPPVDAFDQVTADYLLLARGIQLIDSLDTPSGSDAMGLSPAYTDAPFGSVSWTPPIARTYWFETHLSMLAVAFSPSLVRIRLVVGAQNIDSPEAKSVLSSNVDHHIRFITPVTLATTAPVIIRWLWIGPASSTLSANSNHMRVLRVWA